jgi:hypothetical protein
MGVRLDGAGFALARPPSPARPPPTHTPGNRAAPSPPSPQETLPCAEYYKRQGFPLKKIVAFASNRWVETLNRFGARLGLSRPARPGQRGAGLGAFARAAAAQPPPQTSPPPKAPQITSRQRF